MVDLLGQYISFMDGMGTGVISLFQIQLFFRHWFFSLFFSVHGKNMGKFMETLWRCKSGHWTGPIEFFLAGSAKLRNDFEYDNYEKVLEKYKI